MFKLSHIARPLTQEKIKRIVAVEREQMRLREEQARQAQVLEKHEAWLVRHDEEIEKLKFKVSQAESDIAHLKEHVGDLYGLLDAVQVELDQAIIGGKTQIKLQKQAITLKNQIHAAESKLAKAQFSKHEAERKMEEVA